MPEAENTYQPAEPGPLTYLAGLVLGSIVAFGIASLWLGVTAGWVALLAGAALALFGVFLIGNIGEAIMFALVLGLIVFVFVNFVPGLAAIKAGVVPGAFGLSIGKLVVGIWKEIAI